MVKKQLTQKQKDNIQKFVLYPLVGLVSLLIFYLIFRPTEDSTEVAQQGFNTEITAGEVVNIEEDKAKIYENDMLNQKKKEREYIKDLGSMLASENEKGKSDTDELYLDGRRADVKPSSKVSKAEKSITASTNAYRDINKNLSNFYETPKVDPEKEKLQKRIEELEAQQEEQNLQVPPVPTVDEQMALLEKSYELAAKYSNPNGGSTMNNNAYDIVETKQNETYKNGKAQIAEVKQVHQQVVSSLAQPMTNEEFARRFSSGCNRGFNTAVGRKTLTSKNTIAVCVHNDQTITDGRAVRMRLLEPMVAGNEIITKGSIITGVAKVQGERLYISISSLEYKGVIIPVELLVADSDGQEGIFIPNSMELNAVKEVAANMGSNLGTTINLTSQSAGDVLLTELGKGAIQGASQYISKKMREVKVHLKAGYRLMLYQEQQ